MIVCIAGVLSPEAVPEIREALGAASFVDGRTTAGWHARLVKHNTQLAAGDPHAAALDARVRGALEAHEVFRAAVLPRRFRPLLFSRTEPGMGYGAHVDDALMGGVRTDVSFTVFLSDPATYDGGALVIESPAGEQAYKLEPGAAIVYPSSTLHRVEPVTRGVREAAVGWAESFVRAPDRRELLFELDTARRAMFGKHGKTPEFDALAKTYANLLRMWAET